MSKPFKVHVTVCGTPAGAYEFDTLAEAQADMQERKKFEVLGCHYRLEEPMCDIMEVPRSQCGCPDCGPCLVDIGEDE